MAARKVRVTQNDRWIERIQASKLINRLVGHASGEIELTTSQIRAIEILLKKVVPDLAAVQHSGEIKSNVTIVASVLDERI